MQLSKQLTTAVSLEVSASDIRWSKRIGEGASGEVWLGEYNNTHVAIKKFSDLYNRDYFCSEEEQRMSLESARQEVQIMSKFNHENIVKIFGASMGDGEYFVVMEYMPCGDLLDLVQKNTLMWSVKITLAVDIGQGLQYLHSMEYLHRDLKSKNVLVYRENGHYRGKLADFGVARRISQNSVTNNRILVGTLPYLSPEIMQIYLNAEEAIIGTPKYTVKSDIYSCGFVFWEITSNSAAFKELTQFKILSEVPKGYRPKIPADCLPHFAGLISRCWAQRAEDRPASAEEIVNTLKTDCSPMV